MNDAEQHDGEREVKDHDRRSSKSYASEQTAKLVAVEGSGLSGPFIRRPVMTVLLTLSVIVAGLATYGKLAVNDLPAVDYPVIQVSCSYPGADPTTMANNIATPLEKQFLQIPGLDIITSTSTQANTSFTLQFILSKSIVDAATDVQAAIQRATGKLPLDLPSPPTFTKTNPNDQAVYLLGLMSDTLTDWDLYKYASTAVAQRINILPGVSQVNIYGVQGAIRVKADPSALAARGLTMDDLASGIKSGTVYSGAGQFDGTHRTFVLQPNGQLDKAEGYRELIVARNPNGAPVYLRDVADVRQSVQDERISRFFWVRGFNPPGSVVVLAVSRQAGANAVEVANSVKALFPELRASLPGSIKFTPVFDRSQTIVNSADEVKWTLIIAFVLVVLVIYVFLGRATDTLIPAVALPMSLLLTVAVMYARILGDRKAGHKRAWMERHTTNFIQRVIAAYGRALDWFLDRAWLTVPILIVCILGLWFFFTHLPFTLLPPGDSGFIRGVFIAQEGSSPAQMRAYQTEVNKKLQEDPAVGQFFTLAGFSSRSALSQGLMFLLMKPC